MKLHCNNCDKKVSEKEVNSSVPEFKLLLCEKCFNKYKESCIVETKEKDSLFI